METLIRVMLAFGMVLAASTVARAGDIEWDDIWAPYVQRIDKSTATSGNAAEVNTVTKIITPWPMAYRPTYSRANGARQAGAIGRYENSMLQNGAGAASPIAKAPGETGDSNQTAAAAATARRQATMAASRCNRPVRAALRSGPAGLLGCALRCAGCFSYQPARSACRLPAVPRHRRAAGSRTSKPPTRSRPPCRRQETSDTTPRTSRVQSWDLVFRPGRLWHGGALFRTRVEKAPDTDLARRPIALAACDDWIWRFEPGRQGLSGGYPARRRVPCRR